MRFPIAVLLSLVLPASASAATLGEVPPLAGRGDAACVGATGTPGEFSLGTGTGVRFYAAAPAGFQLRQTVKLGEHFHCELVRTRPGGAGLIVSENESGELVAT